jgi:hypothetical protein
VVERVVERAAVLVAALALQVQARASSATC